jgi:hypothetical protein
MTSIEADLFDPEVDLLTSHRKYVRSTERGPQPRGKVARRIVTHPAKRNVRLEGAIFE